MEIAIKEAPMSTLPAYPTTTSFPCLQQMLLVDCPMERHDTCPSAAISQPSLGIHLLLTGLPASSFVISHCLQPSQRLSLLTQWHDAGDSQTTSAQPATEGISASPSTEPGQYHTPLLSCAPTYPFPFNGPSVAQQLAPSKHPPVQGRDDANGIIARSKTSNIVYLIWFFIFFFILFVFCFVCILPIDPVCSNLFRIWI